MATNKVSEKKGAKRLSVGWPVGPGLAGARTQQESTLTCKQFCADPVPTGMPAIGKEAKESPWAALVQDTLTAVGGQV